MASAWHLRRAAALILGLGFLASCRSFANPKGGAAVDPALSPEAAPVDSEIAFAPEDYSFPARIDSAARYLFYLHGKIVEDQGLPAVSEEFGEYRYKAILEALQGYGFVVISELRPRDADSEEFAIRLAGQIEKLLIAGVSSGSITVVGASKGAAIAVLASHTVADPGLSYVLLGSCHPARLQEWAARGVTLTGHVLAIRDVADVESAGSCETLFEASDGMGLGRHEELVLQVGTGHGILYAPLAEWVEPVVRWANRAW